MKSIFFLALLSVSYLSSAQNPEMLWEMQDLGRKVNSRFHDSAPIVSPDGNTLYFFVADHPENKYGTDNSQDIWYSEKNEYGEWGNAIHMGFPLNAHRYNQVMSVLSDGNTLLIRGTSGNSEGLSLSKRINGKWSNPKSLRINEYERMNKGRFSGAYMTSDGQVLVLYFSETKDANRSDLYVSFNQGNNSWSKPLKIDKPISTHLDDFGPYITSDNKTMFFASNRGGGYGSTDIYKTERLDDTWLNWTEPLNVGPPINTGGFDAYFSLDKSGENAFTTRAFMSADGGSLDIIGLVPVPNITISGFVKNKLTNQPIEVEMQYLAIKKDTGWVYSNIEGYYTTELNKRSLYEFSAIKDGYEMLIDTIDLSRTKGDIVLKKDFFMIPQMIVLSGYIYDQKDYTPMSIEINIENEDSQPILVKSNEDGFYHTKIPFAGNYYFRATRAGYINLSDSMDIAKSDHETGATKDLYMMPIEVGLTVRLNNIFFDFDKTSLRPESIPQLERVVKFMEDNPTIEVEIGGHTDSKGTDDYNNNLSQGRAEAVVYFVIENGIDSDRIIARGYGETIPVDSNTSDEGRQTNRRVEFKILNK